MSKQTQEEYAEQLKSDIEFVFSTEPGKRVMDFLEQICHYNLPTLNNGIDGVNGLMKTLVNDGKREVILTLKTIQQWPPKMIADEILKQAENKGEV